MLQMVCQDQDIALHYLGSYNGCMPSERGTRMLAQIERGQRLRAVRQARGLELTEVAARLGMSASNFGRYENGLNEIGTSQIEDFATALGVTPRELIYALFPDLDRQSRSGALHFRSEHPAPPVDRMLAGASA